MRIPNITHFVFGLREQREPLHLTHYLCLESCRRVLEPEAIFFHHRHRPYGPYWEMIEPHLTLVEVDLAEEVLAATYDERLVPRRYRYAHHADFVRLDALIEHGGVYADIDTLFVRRFERDWFEQPFAIGREEPVRDELTGELKPSLCNAVLLSAPGSEFARTWREEMTSALNGTWSNHSNFLAQELSERLPEAALVLPRSAFFKFGATEEGIESIFERLEDDLDDVYSIHLWSHLWWDEERRDFSDFHAGSITESHIRRVDTTYNVLARPFLPAAAASGPRERALHVDYLSLAEASGYGVAARRAMDALRGLGQAVCWQPFVPSHAWGLGYAPSPDSALAAGVRSDARARSESPDVAVAHLTPEYYPRVRDLYPRAQLVGHTVWETDTLPGHWPDLLEIPDLLIVPCRWNAEVIERAGVSTPIAVVPHVAELNAAAPTPGFPEVEPETFVFYTIGAWTARKAIWNTVLAYQRAFTADDPVLLIVKTGPIDHTVVSHDRANPHHGTTSWSLARLLGRSAGSAPVQLVTRELSDGEISALHARGDCFVSLCRSEGWGLTSFDAATRGVPVVITGFGGHLDYLNDSNALLVDHEVVPVDDPAGQGSYTLDQNWAEPSIEHAAALLRSVVDAPAKAARRASIAREQIAARYAPRRVGQALLECLQDLAGD